LRRALSLAEFFATSIRFALILETNIVERSISQYVENSKIRIGCAILLKEVSDPSGSACRRYRGDKIIRIDEKPANRHRVCRHRIYMYDPDVFEFINAETVRRGELESHVNNCYIKSMGKNAIHILDGCGRMQGLLNLFSTRQTCLQKCIKDKCSAECHDNQADYTSITGNSRKPYVEIAGHREPVYRLQFRTCMLEKYPDCRVFQSDKLPSRKSRNLSGLEMTPATNSYRRIICDPDAWAGASGWC